MRFVVFPLLATVLLGCPKPVPPPPAAPDPVGPAPLRRLTNTQYLNALDDVLGPDKPALDELPADAVVGGFDNAAEAQTPSDLRVSRWQHVAQQYAELATSDDAHLARVLNCTSWNDAASQAACRDSFFATTLRRLYRRTLTAEELERETARFAVRQTQVDFAGAVQLTLEAALQSPQFLYRPEVGAEFDGVARATRLSMLLWDSGPDDALMNAAESGDLTQAYQAKAQAVRMLNDPRAQRAMWNFHRQWLALERLMLDEHSARTAEVDASWTAATQAAALAETRRFVEHVMVDEGTLSALLTSRRAWLDTETARLYGVTTSVSPDTELSLDESKRSGILTRAAFLAGTSHRGATSPPIRGNSVNLHLLCRLPTPPPPGVNVTPPTPGTDMLTNRQLFEQRTSPGACAGCHRSLNGFGFGFEHYNAAAAWQDLEQGKAIDARGEIFGTDIDRTFDGALELSAALAGSPAVHQCATQMWVRYALGRAPADVEAPWVTEVSDRFVAQGGDVKSLLLDVVTAPTFMTWPKEAP
ncbi:MAG: DUF1592 domain-containing protein [Archangium sp.]